MHGSPFQGLAFRVADIRGPQSAGICGNLRTRKVPALRVEKSFRRRPLQTGRRMRRPYKDTPPTRAVRRAGGIPWARFHSACAALDPELGLTEV